MRAMRATRPESPITFYSTEKPVQDAASYSDAVQGLFRGKSNVWVQRAPRPMNALRLWETSHSSQQDLEGEADVKGREAPHVVESAVSKAVAEAQWQQRFDMLFPPVRAGDESRAGSEGLKEDVRKPEATTTRDYHSD